MPEPMRRLARVALLAACIMGPAAAAAGAGVSGAYLAAIVAERRNDVAAAARYFAAAVRADPARGDLRYKAMLFQLAAGDAAAALREAGALADAGAGGGEAALILAAEEIRAGAFTDALARLESAEPPVSPALVALVGGWAASVDDPAQADLMFDRLAGSGGLADLALWHKAMARAVAGDPETAAALLADREPGLIAAIPRALRATAELLAATGRQGRALALLDAAIAQGEEDPALAGLRARIASGEPVRFALIPNATLGVAEALFHAAVIAGRGEQQQLAALVYARLALHLDPAHDDARIEAARELLQLDQQELAIDLLAGLAPDSPLNLRGQVMRADALMALGRSDEAIEILARLQAAHPDSLLAATALAQALHREERWAEAAEAYGRAIAILDGRIERRHWPLFYRRGIAYERAGRWELAEADFRQALELEPDQPDVLNYLGYSLVEMGMKLEEAEAMIRRAVELAPDNGFITDSLAWVLYRLGRFEEAVAPMERAVALEPNDPILNDHLGDILWMVGRRMEARFQWKRALSLGPEEKEIPRIRRKLEVGLDRVLEEERARRDRAGDGG